MFYWLVSLSFANPILSWINADGTVDYKRHTTDSAHQSWVNSLSTIDIPTDSKAAKAFWINTYNALTIHVVLRAYPITSIRDIDNGSVWKTQRFQIGGETLTLDDIEHRKLAAFKDPRTHAALSCASLGCPKLQTTPYLAASLDKQLNQAARAWIAHNAYSYDDGWFSNTLYVNAIFDWYAADFPVDSNGFINPRIPDKYHGPAQFMYQHGDANTRNHLENTTTVNIQEYNWALNDVQP